VKNIEDRVPLANIEGHGLNKVLKFWIKLNPGKPFKDLTSGEYERLSRSIGRLRILWN